MGKAGRISKQDAGRLLGEGSLRDGLAANERAQRFEHAATRPFAAGEIIFLVGSAGDAMMVVRLAEALLRLTGEEVPCMSPAMPQVGITHREFGNSCGPGRGSISECPGSGQRRGIVRIHDRLLTIANRTALQDLAGAWAAPAAIVPALRGAVSP